MDLEALLYDERSQFITVNLLITLCILLLALLLIMTLFYLRIRKKAKNNRKQHLTNLLLNFVTAYLFDEDFDNPKAPLTFKQKELITNYDKKIAIKQLLVFNKNVKGKSNTRIKDLFAVFGLHEFVFSQLQSKAWQDKARALFVLSKLSVQLPETHIKSLINHKKVEVRQQCLLYILKLAESKPLDFLNTIERPLTLWEEIHIEDNLKHSYKGKIPDFSNWLSHKYESVILFAIRMISEFNQFENISKIENLLKAKNDKIRVEAMHCLARIGSRDMIPELIANFENESDYTKKAILDIIRKNGNYEQFTALFPKITTAEDSIKIKYFNMNYLFNSKKAYQNDNIKNMLDNIRLLA